MDDRRLCFVELNKYAHHAELYTRDLWAEFLSANSDTAFEQLKSEGNIMAEAVEQVSYFTKEQKDRYWDDMIKKYDLDMLSHNRAIEREAKAKGLAEGRAEGIIKKALEDASKMLEKGYPEDDILYITGITKEQLKTLH